MFPKGLEPGDKMTMSFTKSPKPPMPSWMQSGASPAAASQQSPAGSAAQPMGMPAVPPMDERAMLMQMMARNRPMGG